MKESSSEIRLRYPVHALLLVGVTWVLYVVVALICALFMLPCVPLAPAFVMIVVALGGLLSSVHEYAKSVAKPYQVSTLQRAIDGQVAQAPRGAQEPC